ncbi:phage baseplate assembly protein V, partial [Arthrospira platensis SPKY1]|nr:phage baseplate assembly protein V [Arthrospira platensis SPKY1]
MPSAGHGYGVSLIPRLNEMVVVGFIDQDNALVLGSVWSGQASHPDAAAPVERRYVINTPNGAVIEMDDQGPAIEMRTAQGARIRIDDAAGGAITLEVSG